MKKIFILMIMTMITFALCSCGNNDASYSDTDYEDSYIEENDDGGKISDNEIEDIAIQTLYEQLLSYENSYGSIDAGACKYNIGSIERDDGQVEVYGIVYFYDKYGGVTDFGGDYSRDFTIHMTEWGSAAWCEL